MGWGSFLNPFKGSVLNPGGYAADPRQLPGGLDPLGLAGGSNGSQNTDPTSTSSGLGALGMQGRVNASEPGRPGGFPGRPMGAPGMGMAGGFGEYMAGLGYTGPQWGTQEFRDARAAGERPYMDFIQDYRAANPGARPFMDWRQSQGGWGGGIGMGGGFGGPMGGNAGSGGPRPGAGPGWGGGAGWTTPGAPSQPQPQGVAVGEPYGLGGLGERRRPNPLTGR